MHNIKNTGPMDEEDIKRAHELVDKIGRNEIDGFFMAIEREKIDETTTRGMGPVKVSNVNQDFILQSVMKGIHYSINDLIMYCAYLVKNNE